MIGFVLKLIMQISTADDIIHDFEGRLNIHYYSQGCNFSKISYNVGQHFNAVVFLSMILLGSIFAVL